MTRKYYACIRSEMLHTETLKELSELYCEIRDESGEGCSTFLPVNVGLAGTPEIIGHISYNGRVWAGPVNGDYFAKPALLYENRLPVRPNDIDEPPQPVDDGGCDPLYGQRMDSADMGEC